MIRSLESYIRDNWNDFNLPFAPPSRLSFVLLQGFRKTIFFLFKYNHRKPFGILKISNDPIVFERLSREYKTLSYLHSMDALKMNIPSPLAYFEIRGHKCLFESAVEGDPMIYLIGGFRSKRALRRMQEIFNHVVDILVTLHKISREPNADKKQPTVIEHGDFNPTNLHISRNGIQIFDWEYSSLWGIPLHDLLDFSLKYVLFARYLIKEINRGLPVLDDFEEAFLSGKAYTEIIWNSIFDYLERIEMHESLIHNFFSILSKKYLGDSDAERFLKNQKKFLSYTNH